MRTVLAVLLILWSLPVFGQITVPDRVDPYQPIVAGCNCIIPAGGKAQFMWSADKASKYITSDDGFKLYIWAPPGRHSVDVVVLIQTMRKVWIIIPDPADPQNKDKWKLQEIEVNDKNGVTLMFCDFCAKLSSNHNRYRDLS